MIQSTETQLRGGTRLDGVRVQSYYAAIPKSRQPATPRQPIKKGER